MHNKSLLIVLIILIAISSIGHAKTSEIFIDGIGSLKVYIETFSPEKHTLEKCGDYVCLIDGAPFFGSDGKIPSEKMVKLEFLHKEYTISLDVSSMYDPNVNDSNIKFRLSADHYWGPFYKIFGRFSDGSGTYIVEWIVTEGGSIRTHISDFEGVHMLFKKVEAQ